jgi:hypothetical protein
VLKPIAAVIVGDQVDAVRQSTSDGTNSYCYSSENLLTGENGTCAAPTVVL